MDTFGDRLTSERKDRGLSIQDVAEALCVDQNILRALERNDFDSLPGEAEMMDCLHAYAECLEVEADLMIEDYVQERENHMPGAKDAVSAQVAEPGPAPIPPAGTSPTARTGEEGQPLSRLWLLPLAVAALGMLTAWWMLSRGGTAPAANKVESADALTASVASVPTAAAETAVLDPPKAESLEPPADTPTTVPREPQPETPAPPEPEASDEVTQPSSPKAPVAVETAPADPSAARAISTRPDLRVTEYGVGTRVVDRQLVDRGERFPLGTRVVFWTRVRDAKPGDRIDHVWLREGIEAARLALKIGSANWRTHSIKTLHPGSAGNWAVEARDSAGRVLARTEFVCDR